MCVFLLKELEQAILDVIAWSEFCMAAFTCEAEVLVIFNTVTAAAAAAAGSGGGGGGDRMGSQKAFT